MLNLNNYDRNSHLDSNELVFYFFIYQIVHACSVTSVMSESAIPWTVALWSPLSMGFSRQEYWRGFPCPPPRALLDPGIESMSLSSPALANMFFITSTIWKVLN